MKINFESISEFCVTKTQTKKITALKKKFSFNNSGDREKLTDLLGSFFANEIYDPFLIIVPQILEVKFEEDFERWGDVEFIIGLAGELPVSLDFEREKFFKLLESVVQYKSKKGGQEGLDNYFSKHLSLYFVNEAMNDVNEAVQDEDAEYEYYIRLNLISSASLVKIINQKNDERLDNQMNDIISAQISHLKEERLLKYS